SEPRIRYTPWRRDLGREPGGPGQQLLRGAPIGTACWRRACIVVPAILQSLHRRKLLRIACCFTRSPHHPHRHKAEPAGTHYPLDVSMTSFPFACLTLAVELE